MSMNSLLNPPNLLSLKPPSPPFTPNRQFLPQHALSFKPPLKTSQPLRRIQAAAADHHHHPQQDIDMVKNPQGVYAPRSGNKVVVLWDLDNKPPRGPPYAAATSLKSLAQRFGEVADVCAYANRHAFNHLPAWVAQDRRERRHLDRLERKGVVAPPSGAYTCAVCGRKCKTNLDLKKHFNQLHARERQKKLNRMKALKGKKRQRYKERFISGNEKYNEAARVLVTPKVGYGLAAELRRAGVNVRTVEDKPQAADWAVKREMERWLSGGIGIGWLVLVSDDSDFGEMLRRVRGCGLGTVVVGDADRALGRHADLWVPWGRVESGELSEDDLGRRRRRYVEREDGFVEVKTFGGGVVGDLDSVVEELVSVRTDFHVLGRNHKRFFDEEEDDEAEWLLEVGYEGYDEDDELVLDSDEEEEGEDDDGYF